MPNPSEYFILSIISHDNRAVAKSIAAMMSVSIILKRQFVLNMQTGTGIANARTKCLESIKKQFPNEDSVYTFWLDSDIIINEKPEVIAQYILDAEKKGVSFTGSYHVVDNTTSQKWNVVGKQYPKHYTDDELKSAKPFELKAEYSGLGLCYIKTPLSYKFRTEEHEGEDTFFYRDNKVDLWYVPISNSHMKTMYI